MPDVTQICLALWAGQQRVQQLEAMPLFSALNATPGANCPGPTAAQLAQLTQQTNALAPGYLTLAPPDGGWPDGSGPSICDDPSRALDGLPAEIAASLAAGRASWNAAADAKCALGMVQSSDLLTYVYSDGGSFVGEAQTIGSPSVGGGPCTQILQGQVVDGGSCVYPFDCAAGLFCESAGVNGSCSGVCQPLVPAGAACGPLSQCVGTLSCTAGFCGGPDAGPPPTHDGGLNAVCATDGDCQACLVCTILGGGLNGLCRTQGLSGEACASDYSCGIPWFYCDLATCAPAATFGQPCTATTSSYACLDGWCDGTICQPISAVGGPCSDSAPSCLAGLYCEQPQSGMPGTCAPLPTVGETCGLTAGLSYECAGANLFCNTDAGSCASLPGPGSPCALGYECATDSFCNTASDGGLCVALQTVGNSCATVPCQAGLSCDAAGDCITPLAGGQICQQNLECQSGSCVGGMCATPCSTAPFGGCENQGVSFILGLGGALVWFDRRRRKSPFRR